MMTRAPDDHIDDPAEEIPPEEDLPETGPLRRCLVTRESCAKEQMIRFVVDPDGRIVADLAASLPGRGFWVLAERAHILTAIDKRLFARAARRPVVVGDDLLVLIERGLVHRCRDLLALCRRSGQVIAGFEKVHAALKAGGIGLVLIAADAADDGRQKIAALAAGVSAGKMPVLSPLDAVMMGQVFGRDHLVHVAVQSGGLASTLAMESRRLIGVKKARIKEK